MPANRSASLIRRSASLLCALAGLAGMAIPAAAQCDIYRLDIPDFDQRREATEVTPGLPANGSAHCAPTSAANWLAYITNHGYPEVLGGIKDWQSNTHYNFVTELIDDLGFLMQTDGGTSYGPYHDAMKFWLEGSSPGNFTHSYRLAKGGYAPSPKEIHDCIANGELISFGTCRWYLRPAETILDFEGNFVSMPQRWVKTSGGHAVSVARVTDACSAAPTIWVRDPAGDDGDRFTQAPFVTKALPTEPRTGFYAATPTSSPVFRTMYRLVGDDPATFSSINGIMIITPKRGLSVDAQNGVVTIFNLPRPDDFGTPLPPATHATPGNAPILSLQMHPQFGQALIVGQTGPSQATLWRFQTGTGEFQSLGVISNPGPCTFGRSGEFFIASGNQLLKFDVAGSSAQSLGAMTLPATPSALAYDDRSDQVVAAFAARRMIGTAACDASGAFGSDYSEIAMPSLLPISGQLSAACSPVDGSLWLCSSGQPNMYRLEKLAAGGYSMQTVVNSLAAAPRNLAVDSRGHILFTSGGIARELRPDAAGGWEADPTAKFGGLAVGDFFAVSPGRLGEDDLLERSADGIDVPPTDWNGGVPDCAADFNGSGAVTVQDIFDFLAAYFAGSGQADVNLSGSLTVQDIFDFLVVYFGGCN